MEEPFYKTKKFRRGAAISVFVLLAFILIVTSIPMFLGQREKASLRAHEADFRSALHKSEVYSESQLSYIQSAEASESVLERKLIKKAQLELKVDSIETAVGKIKQITDESDGVIIETSMRTWSDSVTGYAVIKVPSDKFGDAVKSIKTIARKVNSENISTEDVTEKYIDYEARLNNMKAEEESLLKLLKKAEKIEDTISVTKEISRVRGEIDSLQGQLDFLKGQIIMSTITIELRTDSDISIGEWNLSRTVKSSYVGLANNFKGFVRFVIEVVFYLPIIILSAYPFCSGS